MPAVLCLQNLPVSPVGRWVARVMMGMMGMILVLFIWSVLGEFDISVNAAGKMIQSERIKAIACVEVSRVSGIFVKEGQTVRAGEVLLELDTRTSDRDRDRDRDRPQGDNAVATLQAARSRALFDAIDSKTPPRLAFLAGINAGRFEDAQSHLTGQWRDFSAQLRRIDGEIQRLAESLPLV